MHTLPHGSVPSFRSVAANPRVISNSLHFLLRRSPIFPQGPQEQVWSLLEPWVAIQEPGEQEFPCGAGLSRQRRSAACTASDADGGTAMGCFQFGPGCASGLLGGTPALLKPASIMLNSL